MFLKRLELIGFKSFADRIGIDFVPGVTAVVGPNGSGKSNISDAIRWVLGEQSVKSLRGTKMEDVIFSGSDSRKPLNFAEVTLVLDNSMGLFPLDYTEISVSRRVFRSGESVYLLNGQQCRLKDIKDVFLDSGLGKEAFSIISQGRVDEILNSRPENRRSIFDEAAGVLKYRTRKRKAEHKLFETADNLDRVLDILKELDFRLGPLKQRAIAAKEHAELTTEAERTDILLLNYDAHKIREQLRVKAEELTTYEEQKSELERETKELEKELNNEKEKLIQLDGTVNTLQKKLVSSSSEIEKWEGRRLLYVEKERYAGMQSERISEELESQHKERKKLQAQYEEACKKSNNLKELYAALIEKTNAISKVLQRSVKETEAEITELKGRYIDGLNKEATMRNELKHLAEQLIGERSSSERMIAQYEKTVQRLRQLQKEKQQTDDKQKEVVITIARITERYKSFRDETTQLEIRFKEKQEMLQKAYNKQHEMQGRILVLESMEANFSGFNQGVKEVLQARRNNTLNNITGAVAELITVEPRYVQAIETALGASMQHIIVETEQAARQAIHYLKSKNKGRATFLPLDVMRSRKLPPTVLQTIKHHEQFVQTADALVQIDKRYERITENLLGNVLIAKTLEGASSLAKEVNYRYRIVTLDGDIINAGGSLTGGGASRRTTVFSQKAELEALQKQQIQFNQSVIHAEKTIATIKMDLAQSMEKVEQERKQLEALQVDNAAVVANLRELTNAIDSVENEIKAMEIGKQGSQMVNKQLTEKYATLEVTHKQLEQELKTIEVNIASLERFASDWRTEEKKLTEELSTVREQAAIIREQKSHMEEAVESIRSSEQAVSQKISSLEEELTYVTSTDSTEQLSLEAIVETIASSEKATEQTEKELDKAHQLRITYVASIEHKEAKLTQLRKVTEEALVSYHAVKVQFSKIEVTYDALLEKLVAVYGLYPEEEFDSGPDFNVGKKRELLITLKDKLSAIGLVNPAAISEYEEVVERHRFLTEQRNDLLEAKSTLKNAMSEMDEEMTTRFSSTFHAIQHRFREVFKRMFGGGNADLILTDPQNLLETGVEIVARPPGKKMQNLMLLSGGERALTAISLLFATIEVRPVPFCILDEVEAALDEANVLRYSNYLKKFSEDTQFIVITHRKGTMEGADILYGITMQESGVSKLISVKISDYEELVQ